MFVFHCLCLYIEKQRVLVEGEYVCMKVYAYYLPQFHQIPENDIWWGKGFTEWTNSSAAKPLFTGHRQPQEPLDDNYYNLLNEETIKWQTDLAKKYGVDGFIYYHYYFTGKKLLEKPAENLLKLNNIQHNFFFCWANHTWYKSVNGQKMVLQKQKYGSETAWRQHFEYLIPFFQDERYEKIDNKPVFMIFQQRFKERTRMVKKFDEWCRDYGFAGIYIIESAMTIYLGKTIFSGLTRQFSLREPNHAKFYSDLLNKRSSQTQQYLEEQDRAIKIYDGNALFDIMIKRFRKNRKVIHNVFFGWDNTPRHGSNGYIITSPDKEHVMKYLDLLKDDNMLIVNAWNEWAEGMMLEPTKENGFKYLEWIREWKNKS